MEMRTRVEKALQKHRARLMSLPNVTGVGIGPKILQHNNCRQASECAIVVLVTDKVPASALSPHERIPAELDGVPTDVVACGFVQSLQPGDTVVTPGGVGKLFQVEESKAVVEMDFSYLVEYPLADVMKYTATGHE